MPGRLSQRHDVKVLLRRCGLDTVCEQARCPNMAECFHSGTATFLILGEKCTRNCGFCAIDHSASPVPPDPDEPARIAGAAAKLGLRHVVITSVTRDDLADGGAGQFAACIDAVRHKLPGASVEVLVPDFAGSAAAADLVLAARPDVFNHNLETVPRLYAEVRPGAEFERSVKLLQRAAASGGSVIKTGLMVGLGESPAEVEQVIAMAAGAGCHVVTVGQYLPPRRHALAMHRLVGDDEYENYEKLGKKLGIEVVAGRLVRSSYKAESMAKVRKKQAER
ncbi:MAG: lipoyl synthase [Deltaproteobacteria bacterium]|nr:MAG: lipoyl synthase [Deltaproteobacteria bacterium]